MSPSVGKSTSDEFDEVLEHVGSEGRFQHRFNYLYNMFFTFLFAMPCFNIYLAFTIPGHWCHVPGRNETNYTLEEWKQLTLPKDPDGLSYSKCEMYSTNSERTDFGISRNVTKCQFGWEYDTTWYSQTVASEENWVCDKELYVANSIFFCRLGEAIGSLVFGQLADVLGRRPVFLMAAICLSLGRTITAFSSSFYYVFLAACFLGNTASSAVFLSPLLIGVEMTTAKLRTHITMLQFIGWGSGFSAVPAIAWLSGGNWKTLLLASSLPSVTMFFAYKWFPESPRWLAAKGKINKCEKVLRQISKVNGKEFPEEAQSLMNKLDNKKKETAFGVASLFSSWRFAKNSLLVINCVVLCHLIYYSLIIMVTNMSGNPFLNFFLQAIIEFPGFLMGRVLCDKMGRRWGQGMAYSIAGLCCLIMSFVVNMPNLQWFQTILVVTAKCFTTLTVYGAYLLNTEVYPTCVRQSGSSAGFVASGTLGVLAPYIAYMGTALDFRYPYILLSLLAVLGVLSALFLPETKDEHLPDTLAEAAVFGRDQSFWSFPGGSKRSKIFTIGEGAEKSRANSVAK